MRTVWLLLVAVFAIAPAGASHLSEAEVLAMEEACQSLRAAKLAPEKAAVYKNCMASGEAGEPECEAQAGAYGEIRTGAIRTLGKYYDLPECEKAYRAREHFKINPGR